MSRATYMKELEELLSDIPAEEREDAINYYNDYFDAGGEENEEATIEALGSPQSLAKTIKEAGTASEDGEYTETGYSVKNDDNEYHIDKYTTVADSANQSNSKKEKAPKSAGTIILIVILAIFALPILFPLCIAFICVLFGLGAAAFAVIISLIVAVIACGFGALVGGVALIIAGIASLLSNPYAALVVTGFGFIAFALGILFCLGCIKLVGKIVPPVFRWIIKVLRMPFEWIASKRNKSDN